ncbi:MAG: flagellar biosynthetic protein FliR [Gammaproteobacteria bacterium]|nr:flagellar biosynthetic protein FliR [Gammaproteobacteria bacterium]
MVVTADMLQTFWADQVLPYVWPFFRIAGLVMVAPVFGARLVPARVRIGLCLALTIVIAPGRGQVTVFDSAVANAFLIGHELLIGVAMGFCLQLIFDALVIGGQTIAMSMGLGFAMLVDPQRGVSVPVLSQFFVILGILVFLALGGHLALIGMLADSFDVLEIGQLLSAASIWTVVSWGSQMFADAVRIALPAVAALLVVNIAFGVMSRAAPTLNLFAVGFPVALLLGFVILLLNIGLFPRLFSDLLQSSLTNAAGLLRP